MKRLIVLYGIIFSFGAAMAAGSDSVQLQAISIAVPNGWTVAQESRSSDTLFATFNNGDQIVQVYAKQAVNLDMSSLFANGSQVTAAATVETHGPFQWTVMQTSKSTSNPARKRATYQMFAFKAEYKGFSYFGYARSTSASDSQTAATAFLNGITVQLVRQGRSLTDSNYTGKKYYLGFGDATGSPDEMVNEVHYDVKHTDDIFTKAIGGNYTPTTLFDDNANQTNITNAWSTISGQMTSNDMYVQYSSGHGYPGGLAVGVTHSQIADALLGMPAQEIIVFTMACYSGGLVDEMNSRKSTWQDWQSKGRTLFVMTSSTSDQESDTGPGTDPDEPNGPDGSAGSAFGFELWKALIGYADGYEDGVKDGFISLEEIRDYVVAKTIELSTQEGGTMNPPVTGVYKGNLIMNQVPPKAMLAELEKRTAGLSDAEILRQIQELDRVLSVR